MYERKSIVPIEDVLPFVVFGNKTKKPSAFKIYDEVKINMSSQRYQLFAEKGVTCVTCGVTGKYFAIERSKAKHGPTKGGWHLNLYAINEKGEEVLMTKDHIHPRSHGGLDELSNYETMCSPCNGAKGSRLD